jgi:hypothetical protein
MAVHRFPKVQQGSVVTVMRETARDSGRVFYTVHAEERMVERNITRRHVERCIAEGQLNGAPEWLADHESWRVELILRVAGVRLCVAAVLEEDEEGHQVVVITAFKQH